MSALYYDPSNPGRQDVVNLNMKDAMPLMDLDEEKTLTAARNSFFMDSQTLEPMMEILLSKGSKDESEKKQKARELLKNFIIRGFYNTLDILKGEFLDQLSQFGLLEQFFNYFIEQANHKSLV